VLHYGDLDPEALQQDDERVAAEIDAAKVDPAKARSDYIRAVAGEAAGHAE